MKVYPFNKRQLNVLAALLTLLVVCSVYESLRAFGLLSPSLTPSLGKTAESLVDLLSDRAFVVDTVITLARTTFGVLAGAIAGIPIGFLMGLSSWARRGTLPFIDFLRALPAVALFPALATVF